MDAEEHEASDALKQKHAGRHAMAKWALPIWTINGLLHGLVWLGSVASMQSEKSQFALVFLTPALLLTCFGWMASLYGVCTKGREGPSFLANPLTAMFGPWFVLFVFLMLALVATA